MKIIKGLQRSLILFFIIVGTLLFINVIPSFAVQGNLKYYYDDLGRLVFIEDTDAVKLVEYQYDEVGNRSHKITYNSSYLILAQTGNNGSISNTGATIVQQGSGQSYTYTITPDTDYAVADVKVDGVSVGAVTSYTFSSISASHTISVSFNPYTKLLLHMDGTNGSTTFTDSSPNAKIVTAVGNAQISTAKKKFGTASGLFDGTGDFLTTLSNSDWNFGTGNFTIDLWLRRSSSASGDQGFCGQYVDSNNYWFFKYTPGFLGISTFRFKVVENGAVKAYYYNTFGVTLSSSNWYHVELDRSGTNIYLFVNGTSKALTADTPISNNSMPNLSAVLEIGTTQNHAYYLNGYIDEFRVSKGIARHTANFTPPTSPY